MSLGWLIRNRRRVAWLVVALVVVVLAGFSNTFGRAEPTGRYRPLLQTAALDTGCFPLPEGVEFDFPFQVRHDGDVDTDAGERRRMWLQYDEISAEEARTGLLEAFTRAGFEVVRDEPRAAEVRKRGVGAVSWRIEPLDVADDVVVQGDVHLDLPTVEAQSDDPQCSDPFTTKRFDG